MKRFWHGHTLSLMLPLALALAACSDSSTPTAQGAKSARAAASVSAIAGADATQAAAGSAVAAPAVRVVDASGNGVAGVTVRFSVVAGGGSVQSSMVQTSADGAASAGAWTLGRVAGLNVVEAKVADLPAVRFMATGVPGAASQMILVEGDAQSAAPNQAVPVAPQVMVRDAHGNGVAGVAVGFAVVSGGGSVAAANAVTNAAGRASAGSWQLGPAAGTNILSASAEGLNQVSFTATATAAPPPVVSNFHIKVQYLSSMTARQQQAVEGAIARWRTVITGELSDVPLNVAANACFEGMPAVNEVVDDLLLFVDFSDIDGPGKVLGQAGPCYIRTGNGLPILGHLKLDRADLGLMESNNSLEDVVLHEIGHVLGIGTLWESKKLISGAGTSDPFFIGPRALEGYRSSGAPSASNVPVENTGGKGTRDGHWRESIFGNELMTGYISGSTNPLSTITIGSLLDLGYNGNMSAGNSYTVGGGYGGINLGAGEVLVLPRGRVDIAGHIDPIS